MDRNDIVYVFESLLKRRPKTTVTEMNKILAEAELLSVNIIHALPIVMKELGYGGVQT